MGMESKTIWLNGEFVDYEKATLHFLTPGLHYGIGVFEGIRCYGTADGPAIFRLKEHIARFFHSAFCLGFRELPFGEEQIAEACAELVARNAFDLAREESRTVHRIGGGLYRSARIAPAARRSHQQRAARTGPHPASPAISDGDVRGRDRIPILHYRGQFNFPRQQYQPASEHRQELV